ncbi:MULTISPECIES: DUF748 domain-containing protein [unclassified Luteibacter]|uniref:DUF748 domain-containing protein n=1 Tax=unclassified Luteibacter TaxID=2620188 RepID=UPI0008CA2DB6|nr:MULTISPECIES: DUF748 domain-containing protein [unclassified Luteibacter]SEP02113.1 protein of unknown function [Luteibacter sp. UNC138MFCol5.1]SEW21776.1 protein of unknown function [Luteibacter sp. 329MFSha]
MRTRYRRSLWIVGVIAIVLVAARIAMPYLVLDYLNGRLARMGAYSGHIADIDIHLWRGAYSIDGLTITKVDGKVPVPLFNTARADISLSWRALARGRLRGKIDFYDPVLNFVDGRGEGDTQTGKGVDWRAQLKALAPIRLDEVNVMNGTVTFHNFVSRPKVDLKMTDVNAAASNLTNVQGEGGSRVAHLHATAKVLGDAPLETRAEFDPLERLGDFRYELSVRNIKLVKANDLARAYSGLDFAGGEGDFFMELQAKDRQLNGYAKPLFRGLKIFSWKQDVVEEKKNPVKLAYEAVAEGVTKLFKNQSKDQFATRVPISGSIDAKNVSAMEAIVGVLRNAFVEAYKPNLEHLTTRPKDE